MEIETNLIERYLLEDNEEFLNSLIKNSPEQDYFKMIITQKKQNNLSQEQIKLLKTKYLYDLFNPQNKTNKYSNDIVNKFLEIYKQQLLKDIKDEKKSKEEKIEIMKFIQEHLQGINIDNLVKLNNNNSDEEIEKINEKGEKVEDKTKSQLNPEIYDFNVVKEQNMNHLTGKLNKSFVESITKEFSTQISPELLPNTLEDLELFINFINQSLVYQKIYENEIIEFLSKLWQEQIVNKSKKQEKKNNESDHGSDDSGYKSDISDQSNQSVPVSQLKYQFVEYIRDYLQTSVMERLVQEIPELLKYSKIFQPFIVSKFYEEFQLIQKGFDENLNESDYEQVIKNFQQIIEFCKQHNKKFFRVQLEEIFLWQFKCKYEKASLEDIIFQFEKLTKKDLEEEQENSQTENNEDDQNSNYDQDYDFSEFLNVNKKITPQEYLSVLFKQNPVKILEYKQILDDEFDMNYIFNKKWDNFIGKQLIINGKYQEAERFYNNNQQQYQIQVNEQFINLTKTNKSNFNKNEIVQIEIELKNIKKLEAHIYELNTFSYIKEHKNIDENISLEGYNAQKIYEYLYDNNKYLPGQIHLEKFTFQEIENCERGVFVIDFIGEGIKSRAIVYKGFLSYIQEETITGHVLTILDEDKEICLNTNKNKNYAQQTGIWMQDKFFPVQENGKIYIPYINKMEQEQTIALQHQGFCQGYKFIQKEEFFDIKLSYLYNQEGFNIGQKAKVIVQTGLFLNGKPVDLDILEEVSIKVRSQDQDQIPNIQQFNDLKLDNKKKDLEIEFLIKSQLQLIEISFTAKLKLINGKYQNFDEDHIIDFKNYENDNQFQQLFLRLNQDQETNNNLYTISVLEKSGVVQPNQKVAILLYTSFQNDKIRVNLHTDQNGEVHLGNLKDVQSIVASFKCTTTSKQITKTWYLENLQENSMQVCNNFSFIKGEKIQIPYNISQDFKTNVVLSKVQSFYPYQQQSIQDKIKFDEENQFLLIEGLEIGQYDLEIINLQKIITISVIEGEFWKYNKNFINQKNKVQKNLTQTQMFLQSCKTTQNNEKNTINIKGKIYKNKLENSQIGNTRIHVYGFTFLDKYFNNQIEKIQENGLYKEEEYEDRQIFEFKPKNSIYLNNKYISEEIQYVMNRKNQKEFVGNTLDKPSILLKKTFKRETNFEQEVLKKETEFKKQELDKSLQKCKKKKKSMNKNDDMYYLERSCVAVGKDYSGEEEGEDEDYEDSDSYIEEEEYYGQDVIIDQFNNMLNYGCLTVSNCEVKENGEFEINDLPNNYQTYQIVITDQNNSIQKFLPLPKKPIEFSDNTQNSQLDQDKLYAEKRTSVAIYSQEKQCISQDVQSYIIDNSKQLFNIQQQLASISKYSSINEQYSQLKDWEFISNWQNLNEQQKDKKYDEFCCHELNIFIYFKDQEFYKNKVKKFIKDKIEKSFIDHFLLENQQELLEFSKIEKFSSLNSLEKTLIIYYLVKINQVDKAKNLTESIKQYVQSQPINNEYHKSLFDTILLSKKQEIVIEQDQNLSLRSESSDFEECNKELERCIEKKQEIDKCELRCDEDEEWGMDSNEVCNDDDEIEVMEECGEQMSFNCEKQMQGFQQNYNKKVNEQQIRKQFIPGFQNLDKTKEYQERTYYNYVNKNSQSLFSKDNGFYYEFCEYFIKNSENLNNLRFLSDQFIFATKSVSEMVIVQAFQGLSQSSNTINTQIKSKSNRILEISPTNDNNILLFYKNINLSEKSNQLTQGIQITQRFFDSKQRYKEESVEGVKIEQNVDEYVINKVYGSQIIITNCSVANLDFNLLYEIPNGAMPLKKCKFSQTKKIQINSFQTYRIEFEFYFPKEGVYKIYPASISRNEKVYAIAETQEFQVKKEKQIYEMETLKDILVKGTKKDVIEYMKNNDITDKSKFNFVKIKKYLGDKQFYEQVIEIMQDNLIVDFTVIKYVFLHGDIDTFIEYLDQIVNDDNSYSYYFNKTLNHKDFQFLEYSPLLISRVHKFQNQQKSKILNKEFKQTYQNYLQFLLRKQQKQLSGQQLIVLAYYLILQERIQEATKIIEQINTLQDHNQYQIQLDYITAYLDIYTGYPNFVKARNIAQQYQDYPVISWRNLFVNIENMMKEYDGEQVEQNKEAQKEKEIGKNQENASLEESIQFSINKQEKQIQVNYANISQFEVNYYILDLKLLFSKKPFLKSDFQHFSYIVPNKTEVYQVPNVKDFQNKFVEIPQEYNSFNMLIQIKINNKILSETYFANQLQISVQENYGLVKIQHQETYKPLMKVYVKCYAQFKNKSEPVFHRDGYTDITGKFDYAQSNCTQEIKDIEKFAIFLKHDQYGSAIKEAKQPSQLGQFNKF